MSLESTIALFPTDGIQDPQVRNFLDRLVAAWDARNSGNAGFVTRNEFASLTGTSILGVLKNDAATGSTLGAALANLQDNIRNSLLYQLLGLRIQLPDIEQLRNRVDISIAGMSSEQTTRINKDFALASAINNIWASVGGASAVIEDAELAAATPTAAVATKWTEVVAAVTDPNTGDINTAAILEETRAFADDANDTFNTIYDVRAEIDLDGNKIVGGFGLAATSGAGSSAGPTIDFGVRVDKFYIAGTSATGSLTSQLAGPAEIPFIVVTSTQTIGGITYDPGVYMKSAFIVNASITNEKIGNYIASDDFDGAIDGTGTITSFGTLGWALGKGGNAVFSNVKVRGDIEATSLNGVNIVNTGHVTSGAIAAPYLATTTGGSCTLTVVVPSDCAAMVINISPGYTWDGGSKDSGGWTLDNAELSVTLSGTLTTYHATDYAFVNPTAGTYTITAGRTSGAGTQTGMYLCVTVYKR